MILLEDPTVQYFVLINISFINEPKNNLKVLSILKRQRK